VKNAAFRFRFIQCPPHTERRPLHAVDGRREPLAKQAVVGRANVRGGSAMPQRWTARFRKGGQQDGQCDFTNGDSAMAQTCRAMVDSEIAKHGQQD